MAKSKKFLKDAGKNVDLYFQEAYEIVRNTSPKINAWDHSALLGCIVLAIAVEVAVNQLDRALIDLQEHLP